MAGLLEGRAALVTGGGSGIGRATALAFAREGARVLVADRAAALDTVARINDAGGQAISFDGDVTREHDVAAMVAATVAAFGRLDCAFNNAGIAPKHVGAGGLRLHELSRDAWDGVLGVNLTGVFLCLKHEITQMLAQGGGGAIVNTASVAGTLALPRASAYVASKHGVIGATKTAAVEYAADGIRVNAICPGFVATPMTDDVLARRGEALLGRVPMRRFGEPGEIAEAVVWLCSERASFVTGSAWTADGGYGAF